MSSGAIHIVTMILEKYLKDRKISIVAFAKKIGKSRGSVHNFISGRHAPGIETALLIVRATNKKVSLEDVYKPFYKDSPDLEGKDK